MIMNKYLKELGLTWYDLPGNYIPKTSLKIRLKRRWYKIKRGICFAFSSLEDKAPDYNEKYEYQAFNKTNKIDKITGFCDYEFYSLDYSLALYIYPRLCEFRKKYATKGTPSSFCHDVSGKQYPDDYDANGKWLETIDKMILAFKLIIKEDVDDDLTIDDYRNHEEIIQEGLDLFAKYYRQLWW